MPNDDRLSPQPLHTAPEEWAQRISTQAVLLETMLTQLETAFRTLDQSRGGQARPRQAPQRLATQLAHTQAFLHEQAQTPVMLERQLA